MARAPLAFARAWPHSSPRQSAHITGVRSLPPFTALVRALFRALVLAAAVAAAGSAFAQGQPAPPPPDAIEQARADLDRLEARVADANATDRELADLRDRIPPLLVTLDGAIAALNPQLAAADQRLAQIGPKPADGQPAESQDVGREREAQTAARQKVDETIKRARLLQVEAAQAGDEITQRRRALLAQRLFERARSILDPTLWVDVATEAPRDVASVRRLAGDWMMVVSRNLAPASIAMVSAAAAFAVFLLFPARRWLTRLGERLVMRSSPKSRLRRSATALFRLVATTLAPVLAALTLYWALDAAGWLTGPVDAIAVSLVRSAGFLGFAYGMLRALLAPGRPGWRLVNISDDAVAEIKNQPFVVAMVFVVGRVVEQFNGAVVASLSASIATSGLFALLNAATFAFAIGRIRAAERFEAVNDPDRDERPATPLLFLVRLLAWAAIVTVVVAVVSGYVVLGLFLANQVIWISAVVALVWLLLIVVDDLCSSGFAADRTFGRGVSGALGVRPDSLEQIGVLLSGVARLALIGVGAALILAPWGVGSTDLFGWVRVLLTGMQVGGITISLTNMMAAAALVVIGFGLTHAVQRWLDRDLLPKTRMDAGLKASINTGVGYLGSITVIVIAIAYLGFSLDRLAIVAGALSVGIGFGLQAVISNFVSGVILLAERPIKAGDWIVIGSDQGNVRRISVRSTEIELFDRSTLIVPNSDFITKSVKNVTHGSPLGRVQIELSASSAVDPAEVKRVALDAAKSHPSVLGFPEPQLLFTALGKGDNTFALICNVPSPRQSASVKSDLNFALVKAFASEGIPLGGPDAPSMVEAVDRVGEALARLALAPKPHDAADAPLTRDDAVSSTRR